MRDNVNRIVWAAKAQNISRTAMKAQVFFIKQRLLRAWTFVILRQHNGIILWGVDTTVKVSGIDIILNVLNLSRTDCISCNKLAINNWWLRKLKHRFLDLPMYTCHSDFEKVIVLWQSFPNLPNLKFVGYFF